MVEWHQVATDFEPDGLLRDIYVLQTTKADWQRVWEAILRFEPPSLFSIDGVPAEKPMCVEEVFKVRCRATPLLSLTLESLVLNCHFFDEGEIEFDLDPTDVKGQDQLDVLTGFIHHLGRLTRKAVILTFENTTDQPILRYTPDDDEICRV